DRGRGEIFIQAGLKLDVVAVQEFGGLPQCEIEAAERRAAITRYEARGIEARELVALALENQQADERLDAGDEDAPRSEIVFIVERNVAQRRGGENGGHRETPRIVFRVAPRRVGAAKGWRLCRRPRRWREFYAVFRAMPGKAARLSRLLFSRHYLLAIGPSGRRMCERERRHGLRITLERQRTDRFDGEVVAKRCAGPSIDEELARFGFAAESIGEVDDAPDRRVIPATFESEGAERRVAVRDPHADIEIVAKV